MARRYSIPKLQPVPASFVTFCDYLSISLTDAQRVVCEVAYDGVQPEDFSGHWADLAHKLFGEVSRIPPALLRVFVALCGARGGKSRILGATRLLHLALTVNLTSLAPGEWASGLIMAPKIELAKQTFRFVVGAIRSKPELKIRLSNPTQTSCVIQREGSRIVRIECLPAARGGDAARARYYVGAVLDEFAFFRNENYEVNDAEVFQAVTPRILPGGQTILTSTAWARLGLMHKLWSDNWSHPKTCFAVRAPTILLNPSKKEDVALETRRDPVNAAREFGCEFMDAAAGTFFSHDAIDAAADAGEKMGLDPAIPIKPPPGAEVCIGADTGFRRDSSALVVVYILPDGTYVVARIMELQPSPGAPLRPSDVVQEFTRACKWHGCNWLMADGHYRETLDEELAKEGLSYVPAPAGAEGKAKAHMQAKTILHGGKLRMPKHERLIEQMKTLIGRPTAGGAMSFLMPRTTAGGHGDILSALVLALSQRTGEKVVPTEQKPLTLEESIRADHKRGLEKYEEARMERLSMEQEMSDGAPVRRQPWYVQ